MPPTRTIDLREYESSEPLALSVAERDAIRDAVPSIDVTPEPGAAGVYRLRPGATIGALTIGGLSLSIRPKLDVARVLYLASYAMGAFDLRREPFAFAHAPALVEALARAFADAAEQAFARGLLHGYRTREEALHAVRGRILEAQQMRRRFDLLLPVEVRYDEFTDDILANRLVKAAAALLAGMRLDDRRSRDGLRHIDATLANVTPVHFPPSAVPQVVFDRLSGHYRDVVALARLILHHRAVESERGGVRASGFLIDMNVVFQAFVTRALRESLGVLDRTLRSDDAAATLDESGRVPLRPDLSWWDGSTCTFTGDIKYKRIDDRTIPNADLYQALAYATALDLPGALLAYAKGEAEPASYTVRHAGKRLEVAAVDISGSIADIRASIDALAAGVRRLRNAARTAGPPASTG